MPRAKSKQPGKRGRKTKFTTQTVRKILATLRAGYPDRVACMEVGVSPDTYYSWHQQKPEFKQQCLDARREAMGKVAQHIKNQFSEDWRAAAWWLERTQPDVFGRNAEVVVENNTTVNVEVGAQIEGGRALEVVKKQLEHDAIITRN